tara:strand:- start:3418 stop:3636 length:219 start_codon:yes stop_codon:yes gene_type:complete
MAFKKARKKLEEAIKKARLKKAYKKEGMDKKAAKAKKGSSGEERLAEARYSDGGKVESNDMFSFPTKDARNR